MSSRNKRIILLTKCLKRIILKGKADKKPDKISRILFVPTGKLGDIVCNTPVLRALRDNFPNARIAVAGNAKLNSAVLADNNLVDEYIDLENDNALKEVKKYKADVALVTGPSFQYLATVFSARIPFVVAPTVVGGFSPAETRPYKILKKFIKTFPYHIEAYAPRERLRVLESIGIVSDDTKKHLGFTESASKKIKQFFDENKIADGDFVVGISPSAGNKIKEWPEERFAEVADYLISKYQARIIMIGSKSDEEKINRTIGAMKSGVNAIKANQFNIDELKALVSKLKLFVAVDTGPIYIAEAFDIPTVDIVGPVDERVQPPRGPLHRNVVPPNRTKSELSILNARSYNVDEAQKQVLDTTTSMVLREIDDLIGVIMKQR